MKTSYNYQTYYSGTPEDLENASSLIFYNSSSLKNHITLNTFSEVRGELLGDSGIRWMETTDKTGEGQFVLTFDSPDPFDFDVILYTNGGGIENGEIVGYTIFSVPQKCYSSSGKPFKEIKLEIIFNLTDQTREDIYLKIENSFTKVHEDPEIRGQEGYNFPEGTELSISSESDYLKFTNKTRDLYADQRLTITTDSGIHWWESGEIKSAGIWLSNGVDVDINSYPTLKIGVYNGDIVINKYNHWTGDYCVSSLTKLNHFSRPYDILSGRIPRENSGELIGIACGVVIRKYGGEYFTDILETGETIKYPRSESIIVADEWGGDLKIYTPEELKKELTSTCDISVNIGDYDYRRKIGEWWEFLSPSGEFCYFSTIGTIQSVCPVEFLNSRIIYIPRYDKNRRLLYDFCFIDPGHTYDFSGERIIDRTTYSNHGVTFLATTPMSLLSTAEKCLLDGIRHKPLRLQGCLPKTKPIGCALGVMFYLDNEKLYCY